MNIAEIYVFFRECISDPLRVSAVAPSGHRLAELITSEITGQTGPVIELGPGTGAFTRALLKRGVDERNITLVELSDDFARMLNARFPRARVLSVDATRLRRSGLCRGGEAGAVISGLPLLSMSPRSIFAILRDAFFHLREDGALYQFTYGPRCPVPAAILHRLGLRATRVGGTLRNIPPATVYRISRCPSPARVKDPSAHVRRGAVDVLQVAPSVARTAESDLQPVAADLEADTCASVTTWHGSRGISIVRRPDAR
jgi:phosphatidylethanolamine/phosphatidyl-N-methylethanolamine N-methyltransferase